MFAAEFEPADPDDRRAPRAPVSLDAQIGKGIRTLCRVVDISIHGARLQTYSALTRNSMIWLTLPHAGSVAARVRWADDFAAGCQFRQPLDMAVFERLVELNR
ncbi:PilZ domain-containing protein [Sphingomonas sp. A2-49]|uniref:PilZ domain-containing protein n=1 Tax=Sphingomonas sp. A2-49 TaxID=1391375 RepID=UPI0021D379A1|nr:PilZ domain-containing protein [Sphingomonas sp. A2-49]MCU6452909.1 PilZ domain-containing protein [Sphingomonas sp. A2-49]